MQGFCFNPAAIKKDLDCQNLGHYLLEKIQDKTNMAIQDKQQKYLSHRTLLHALLYCLPPITNAIPRVNSTGEMICHNRNEYREISTRMS